MVSTPLVVVFVVIGALLGAVGGFFLARKYMQDYFEKNPPVNEDMLRTMMMSMGQKPSEKKIRQMMQQMKSQNSTSKKK
ncbi:YneF family protein [Enterococcus asini]|uniref:YneF family protein n=1 Tax=Enterococcus TaxID=1350 RepID=UPI00288D341A|nr:YneF family protein [Enterococcus asini]MDT2756506.1 YneF family protein [Enterococcus asini]